MNFKEKKEIYNSNNLLSATKNREPILDINYKSNSDFNYKQG